MHNRLAYMIRPIECSTLENRTIGKVVFKWEEMPNLTKNGDTTNLTYIFGTRDDEFGTNEAFKSFSENVDIVWWACFQTPHREFFTNIDLSQVILASDCFDFDTSGTDLIKESKFLYIRPLWVVLSILDCQKPNKNLCLVMSSQFPKNLDLQNVQCLLASYMSRDPLDFVQWKYQNEMWLSNEQQQQAR